MLTAPVGERDFEDLKLLISHQKAKHFKCDRCGRRLNTAGGRPARRLPLGLANLERDRTTSNNHLYLGLSVHMNQVHKESLSSVENALPNRQGLDVEIFGMEGIPEDIVQQHNQRIIQNFYQAQAERYAATGNPPPGQSDKKAAKKIKIETPDEIKKRLAEHRARLAAQKGANGGSATHTPPQGLPDGHSPAQSASPGAFVCDLTHRPRHSHANLTNRILRSIHLVPSILGTRTHRNTPMPTLPPIFRLGPEAIFPLLRAFLHGPDSPAGQPTPRRSRSPYRMPRLSKVMTSTS